MRRIVTSGLVALAVLLGVGQAAAASVVTAPTLPTVRALTTPWTVRAKAAIGTGAFFGPGSKISCGSLACLAVGANIDNSSGTESPVAEACGTGRGRSPSP